MLGIKLIARPGSGFVHYLPCEIKATQEMFEIALHPPIDICLRRVVRKNVFQIDKLKSQIKPNFKDTNPGDKTVENGS